MRTLSRRPVMAAITLVLPIAVTACNDDPVAPASSGTSTSGGRGPLAAVAAPPGASVTSTVIVPASMRTSPFNTTRDTAHTAELHDLGLRTRRAAHASWR